MDEFAHYAMLLDFYGPLLTERQNEIMDLHFNNDLSLVEIAEHAGISRQGAYDALKKGKRTLDLYEVKLGLAGRFKEVMKLFDDDDIRDVQEIRKRILEIYND